MIRSTQKIKMIKTADIFPNPYQTRKSFERKELSSLCESIKEVGILSPIIVRGAVKGYELICGQRRLRAALMAGLKEIPAIIVRAGDAQCAQISLIENIQRKNLRLTEEAEGYYNLMAYHRIKKDRLLKIISIDSEKMSEKIRLLNLSEKVRYKIEENNFSENISKELLRLHDEEKQLELIDKIIKEELAQSEIHALINKSIKEMMQKKKEKPNRKENLKEKMPVYINTVKKTAELLKQSGARTEILQTEDEEYIEFKLKIYK